MPSEAVMQSKSREAEGGQDAFIEGPEIFETQRNSNRTEYFREMKFSSI
jgi:G:T/U-mismatch repair DNA glycosylase